MRRKEKMTLVLERLAKVIPEPETELEYGAPWELLVAVVLSAQCTDKRVNMTTPALFERFPNPASLAASHFDEVFPYIKSISFPANKT
ncbi:MAG: endonuclease III, partial [Bacteroidota bacterium]